MDKREGPIGIFDSGVGGISVLNEVRALLPREHIVYFGDNGFAPYGTKTVDQVIDRAEAVTQVLENYAIKLLLIACNTATSAAATALRARLSMPVVGMEPALKPAFERRGTGAVLVMATPMTLARPKFAALMERYGEGAVAVPCPGLMEFAERGELDSPALDAHLRAILGDWPSRRVNAVVLGCTHYIFLRHAIARLFSPGTPLLDGNAGTARQVMNLLLQGGLLSDRTQRGRVTLLTSGEPERVIKTMRSLLREDIE